MTIKESPILGSIEQDTLYLLSIFNQNLSDL